ncbi:MAG TPA: hypothetical protein VF501_06665 [Thiobacillus sp.]
MFGLDLEKHVDVKVFMPLLGKWFWKELHEVSRAVPSTHISRAPNVPFRMGPYLLMGCPLWGDEYIARFTTLCLPTLMSARNKAALSGRCRIVLFTNEASFSGLWNLARDMTNSGIETLVYVVPSNVMDKINDMPLNKYWLLGACQQLSIQMAGRWGMAFHALHPDHIHAEAYFENVFRLAEKHPGAGIAQTGISADIHAALSDLEKFRQPDSSLAIPDRDLGSIGWKHLHKQIRGLTMNGVDILGNDMPNSHFLMWTGKDKLYAFCCHMNAVYLPPEATARSPIHLFNAMDTMLPYYMPKDVYVPDADDGLTFIEVSDEKKSANDVRVSFPDWAAQCWNTVHGSDAWMPFFETVCEIPVHEQAEYMEEEAIRSQHATLVEGLKASKEPIMEALTAMHKAMEEKKAAAAKPKSARAMKRQMRRSNGAVPAHMGAD